MKRFISLAITLLLIIGGSAIAETVNLDSLSDDELITMYESIKTEIVSRKIEKTAHLPQGEYVIGRDIPVGTYILRGTHSGDWWTSVYIYTAEEMQKNEDDRKSKDDITIFEKYGEVVHRITLYKDDVLRINGTGDVSITITSGVVFE